MEYTMEWAATQDRFDEVVEDKGARVLIDPKALMYLLGTEMDYRVDKLKSEFVFNNPNQISACGCGESVNLTPVAEGPSRAGRRHRAAGGASGEWRTALAPSNSWPRRLRRWDTSRFGACSAAPASIATG